MILTTIHKPNNQNYRSKTYKPTLNSDTYWETDPAEDKEVLQSFSGWRPLIKSAKSSFVITVRDPQKDSPQMNGGVDNVLNMQQTTKQTENSKEYTDL